MNMSWEPSLGLQHGKVQQIVVVPSPDSPRLGGESCSHPQTQVMSLSEVGLGTCISYAP